MFLVISTFGLTFVVGMHLANPCKTSLAGYWLLPQCQCGFGQVEVSSTLSQYFWKVGSALAKLFVIGVNAWMSFMGEFPTTFMVGNVQILATLSIRSLLTRVSRQKGKDGDFMLNCYRRIQIIANLGNEIQKELVTLFILASVLIQPFCIVYLVTADLSENGISLASFFSVSLLTQSILVLLVYGGGLAGIFEESKATLKSINDRIFNSNGSSSREKRFQQKMLKSCTYLKIRFGSFNYVEGLTPLKCLDFCNQITINVLLLTNRALLMN